MQKQYILLRLWYHYAEQQKKGVCVGLFKRKSLKIVAHSERTRWGQVSTGVQQQLCLFLIQVESEAAIYRVFNSLRMSKNT